MCAGRRGAALLQRPRAAPLRQALLAVEAGAAAKPFSALFLTPHTSGSPLPPPLWWRLCSLRVSRRCRHCVRSGSSNRDGCCRRFYLGASSHTWPALSPAAIPRHVFPPPVSASQPPAVPLTIRIDTGTPSCTATSSSAPGRPRSMPELRCRCVGIRGTSPFLWRYCVCKLFAVVCAVEFCAVCCVAHRFAAARRAAWVRGRRVSEQRFGFVGLILGPPLGAGVCRTRCGK